jgi:PREDICTED: similar to proteasome beta subunit
MVHKSQEFSPYQYNGGTILGVAGKGFAILASDTRLVAGYSIYTRKQSKNFSLTQKSALGSGGCWCDVLTFTKILQARLKLYEYEHNKPISTEAVARLVSNMLYQKRFFPYYVYNVVVGLDENGDGLVYPYDSVGSYERVRYFCSGSASSMIQPVLDNQIGLTNWETAEEELKEIKKERAVQIVKDAFNSATERNIYVGDGIHMMVITKEGIEDSYFDLRKD